MSSPKIADKKNLKKYFSLSQGYGGFVKEPVAEKANTVPRKAEFSEGGRKLNSIPESIFSNSSGR